VQQSEQRQIARMKQHDVLLQPDLGDIAAADFTRMAEAIEVGRQATLGAKDRLARYSVSEAEYAEWRAHQRRPSVELPVIAAVRIENQSLLSDDVIMARIHSRPGERLDLETVSRDLGRVFGLDAFERVAFDVRREAEGMVLVYQVYARERGTHYIRTGLNLESNLGKEADFNFGLNHVWFPIDAWGGELRNEGQFGDTSRVGSELYQPIDGNDWFFALPFVRYELTDVDFWQRREHLARYDLEQTISGMYLGINFGRFAQLRGGIGYLNGSASRRIGDPAVFKNDKFSGGVYGATFEWDTLDDVHFPNHGAYARLDALFVRKELGYGESFERVSGDAEIFHTWRKNTIGVAVKYETSVDAGPRIEAIHTLGGFQNHSGFERDSLTGQHTGLARLLAYRRIASPSVVAWQFPVYVGGVFEIGNAWEHRSGIEDDLLISAGPFVGVDTPLGPLYLAYAHGEGGENQGYLVLGRSF
jgi:NTE family protein